MKNLLRLSTGLCLLISNIGVVVAQEPSAGMDTPPKVMVIAREFTKPGKDGAMHEKTESGFINALTAAKFPSHYFAAKSLSGRPRALFFFDYPSFEAWEKDNQAAEKNPALGAALDKASVADGDLLSDYDQSVWTYDPDLSLHAVGGIVHSRYFEISQYKVKPGHRAEWNELVKLYVKGFSGIPTANWATFESYYGTDNGGTYISITKMTSLSEDDASMNDDKKFAEAMGAEGMKKVRELTQACIESQSTNLFEFNPGMSYPSDEWIKADPFWKPKAAAPKKATPTTP